MNVIESEMVELLIKAKENYGVCSVKAEFEAEGTRLEELLRLVDVGRSAGLPITVKIGGCEAIRDLLEAKQIGCKYIVAPMVETGYAALKFREARDSVYSIEEEKGTGFLFNLETKTGFDNRKELLEQSEVGRGLDGMVLGRHDFVLSFGWAVKEINSEKTTNYALELAKMCKEAKKELVVGGGMSFDSVPALEKIASFRLDRFETRKVIFSADAALGTDLKSGLEDAVRFEYLWLINKRNYYKNISEEDHNRIRHFENRLGISLEKSLY